MNNPLREKVARETRENERESATAARAASYTSGCAKENDPGRLDGS